MKTIKSWIGEHVRIKEEYITRTLNEYDGTWSEWVNLPCGGGGYFDCIENKIFKVQMDCYGVDLFPFIKEALEINKLLTPQHQIIVKSIDKSHDDYPYLWPAEYFEIVERKVTEIWVAK
jgi:hypothetical protein